VAEPRPRGGAGVDGEAWPHPGTAVRPPHLPDLVGHWLSAGPNPFAEILTATPKYVASSTLAEPLPYPSSELLRGPVTEAVAALKEQDGEGDLVVLGSGMLVRALAAGDLVDEYVLTVIPVVLGGGTRLFGDTYAPLEVPRSVTSPTGVVTGTYRVRRD
jgi:dihydrofolate reductase